MPIIDIEIVGFVTQLEGDPDLTQALADALGRVFDSPPGRTWVQLKGLPQAGYAENGQGAETTPRPVFVTILKAVLPDEDELRIEIERITAVVSGILGRPPENVHVLYLPAGRGRVAFGGRLVEG